MKTTKEGETIPVATRVTKPMLKGIQSILVTNAHINVSDYLRDLIRRDLEERGIFKEKEPTKK